MPEFKFRLEKVLELRKKKEEERQRELAMLKELLLREEQFLKELKEKDCKMREEISVLQAHNHKPIDIEELIRYTDYLEKLREKIISQIENIKKLIEDTEKKRGELIDASKEKKIMEKLKDNQFKKFKETVDSWERKILDEIGTINYSKEEKWKV
ncbi:MAG: flagellar export protein FliJ [Candidatus Omnitrophica bacterium]|nr:flagellar export protein FliJ [Candidatus Omnitrophota bacterium]